MDKKEMKRQYMLMRLQDPNVEEWEKKSIRERLGIAGTISADEILNSGGRELRRLVSNYFDEQMRRIGREKRTRVPLDFFSENLKAAYSLCEYDTYFEDDSFIRYFDKDADREEINGLIKALELTGRDSDAELIKSALKKRKYSDSDLEALQDHFDDASDEIEIVIEKFIKSNVQEIIDLCKI